MFDYAAIKRDNERRYGTDIGRIGQMLLADRYDDRTHFLYELLQNAEDAIRRRLNKDGLRTVSFHLSREGLRFSHFGCLFSEEDVRGICGIGESTKSKDLTTIGKFGIGFKAVYAFTDAPEIHSGDEHFAIDSFVWPRTAKRIVTKPGETVFYFPFRSTDRNSYREIFAGLKMLGPQTLLFLREIDQVDWLVEEGDSGIYRRTVIDKASANARQITLLGNTSTSNEQFSENWLVFSRPVEHRKEHAGYVEIAFLLEAEKNGGPLSIAPIADSPLVVFFPTVVQTNLGCLLQGPYRTTPSRDNIPHKDDWNRNLVRETAKLMVSTLHQLRQLKLLTANCLQSLPIDRTKFAEESMFYPLFSTTKSALGSEKLLPCFRMGYTSGKQVKLARAAELRDLLKPAQLAILFRSRQNLHWLSEDITRDRTPVLRNYLMTELSVQEVDPDVFRSRISKSFLEAQSEEWLGRFYSFLAGQPKWGWKEMPIVRAENGKHFAPFVSGRPHIFLPTEGSTGFVTVKRSIVSDKASLKFLEDLGLTKPNLVDDVIANVVPKYKREKIRVADDEYVNDVKRMLVAADTDSYMQRQNLLESLKEANFVRAIDAGASGKCWARAAQVYQATEKLKALFAGVADVLIVDDSFECLKGKSINALLEACGAAEYLAPVPVTTEFDWNARAEMRRKAGTEDSRGDESIEDHSLRGLDELLNVIRSLSPDRSIEKARLLWDALCDVVNRRGPSYFSGTYRWLYFRMRSHSFDAAFVKLLNDVEWVPSKDGPLRSPNQIVFDEISPPWDRNPFLLSRILFKPPAIDALAKEVGIEPGVLDLLRKLGVTSEADLKMRLGIRTDEVVNAKQSSTTSVDSSRESQADARQATPNTDQFEDSDDGDTRGYSKGATSGGDKERSQSESGTGSDGASMREQGSAGASGSKSSSSRARQNAFVSYIAVSPDEEIDPDGLTHDVRMTLEDKAIELILTQEPDLKRTDANNPGFDLFQLGSFGKPIKWVEVKSMTGRLDSRPVAMSKTQFEMANEKGASYWLYIVERADSLEQATIYRIQDPAGRAKNFTFDRGWAAVAESGRELETKTPPDDRSTRRETHSSRNIGKTDERGHIKAAICGSRV